MANFLSVICAPYNAVSLECTHRTTNSEVRFIVFVAEWVYNYMTNDNGPVGIPAGLVSNRPGILGVANPNADLPMKVTVSEEASKI